MSYETIEFSIEDHVATIVLSRPESLNSFNEQMHSEVRRALKQVRDGGEARCLLITGAGRGFCSGQDLSDRHVAPDEAPPDLGETLGRNYNPLVLTMRTLEMPVICAVNGVAAGAGVNVALAADLVLAARSAKFIQSFCKVGLLPDSGGTWILPRLVGRARALGIAMLGEPVSAEMAEAWGMIWKCIDDDKLMDEARTLAGHLATQPTAGLGLLKKAMNASSNNSLEEQLYLELKLQRRGGRTHDYREGVSAFMEKRKPDFRGN